MQAPILYSVRDQKLWLSAQRSIFWEDQKTLIVSDLHFGKTGHFRKAGIAVPPAVYKEDLQRLVSLLHYFKPEQLLVVGDFFHSHANSELDWFRKWRNDFGHLSITLVRGNHDILKDAWYQEVSIQVAESELAIGPFLFIHEACADNDHYYTFCGHLHPGIILNGPGKQSLRFPCFYFTERHCILPAFSKFTGLAIVQPKQQDRLFAVVEDKLMAM